MVIVVLGGSVTDDLLLPFKFLGMSLYCLYILLRSRKPWVVAMWGLSILCWQVCMEHHEECNKRNGSCLDRPNVAGFAQGPVAAPGRVSLARLSARVTH